MTVYPVTFKQLSGIKFVNHVSTTPTRNGIVDLDWINSFKLANLPLSDCALKNNTDNVLAGSRLVADGVKWHGDG
jgi:hypothetical protein